MKRRRSVPTRADIRDTAPTIVLFDSRLSFNGGSLERPEVMRVWLAVKAAFYKAAFEAGLNCSWTAEFNCTTPDRMQARIDRQDLNVVKPPLPPPNTKDEGPHGFDEETQAIQAARHERLGQHPGYLNGYDRVTEADQHHAYMVGFSDAVRAAEVTSTKNVLASKEDLLPGDAPVASQSPAPSELRCRATGNPCGTDTWQAGHECGCGPCQAWLTAFHAPVAAATVALPRAQDWQPIETAPDGVLLLYRPQLPERDRLALRRVADWCGPSCCPHARPTHWQPKPTAPSAEGVTDPARLTPVDQGKADGSAREETPDQILAHGRSDADRLGLDTLPIGGPVMD